MIEHSLQLPGRGTTLVLEASGPRHAPALILLHGLAATALLNWGPSLGPLARGFRVLALDLRGHGRGLPLRGRFRLEDCADDAIAVADALDVERPIAVGYSMGGPIAQLMWRRHRARVAGLVLCATASRFADSRQRQTASMLAPLLSLAARATPSPWQQAVRRRLGQGIADPQLRQLLQREVSGTHPAAVVEAGAALAAFDSGSWIGSVDVPTAVVVTTEDGHVAAARQLELAAAIPGAEAYRVEADHYACVARPDLFVPALFAASKAVALRGPVASGTPRR